MRKGGGGGREIGSRTALRAQVAILTIAATMTQPTLARSATQSGMSGSVVGHRPGGGVAEPVEFGGFAFTGAPAVCTHGADMAFASAYLHIDITQTYTHVASDSRASVAIACLPTPDPQMSRVVVVAASSDPATAGSYRNNLRAIMQQISQRRAVITAGPVPPGPGKAAPVVPCAFSGTGTDSDMAAAQRVAGSLGMRAGTPTPGGEVALTGPNATVVVASSTTNRPSGPLGRAVLQSLVIAFGASSSGSASASACDLVRGQMVPPRATLIR